MSLLVALLVDPIVSLVSRYVRRERISNARTSEWLRRAQHDLSMAWDYTTSEQPDRRQKAADYIYNANAIVGLMIERMWREHD